MPEQHIHKHLNITMNKRILTYFDRTAILKIITGDDGTTTVLPTHRYANIGISYGAVSVCHTPVLYQNDYDYDLTSLS